MSCDRFSNQASWAGWANSLLFFKNSNTDSSGKYLLNSVMTAMSLSSGPKNSPFLKRPNIFGHYFVLSNKHSYLPWAQESPVQRRQSNIADLIHSPKEKDPNGVWFPIGCPIPLAKNFHTYLMVEKLIRGMGTQWVHVLFYQAAYRQGNFIGYNKVTKREGSQEVR